MTKADLDRLEEIRDELKRLKTRIESIRNASVVSATNYSQTSTGGGTGDRVSRTVVAVDEIEYRTHMLRCEGYSILGDVQPESLQDVLALYYLECLPSWAAVSRARRKSRSYANDLYNDFKKQLDNPTTKSYN